jgi:protein involved in polysaccharide export with SLBB domain
MPFSSLGRVLATACLLAASTRSYGQGEPVDSLRDPRDPRESRDSRDLRDLRELRELRESRPAPSSSVQAPVPAQGATEIMQGDRIPAVVPPASLALEEPLDPDTYVCGRGDTFDLNFWGQQNFKLRVTADLEGRTFIARVGYVDIRGRTLTQARAMFRKAVLRYYPGLSFDVSIVEPRMFLVHVVENVGFPGIYRATPVERVSTLLERAGGTKGSIRRIAIRHRDGSIGSADLLRYTLTGETQYNPRVLDGDVIAVPTEGVAVTIGGPVYRPGRYELIKSKDLAELLELAGGLKSAATRQLPLRLVRRDDEERAALKQIPFPADGLPNLSLRDDDIVQIPSTEELQRGVLLIGAITGANAIDEATSIKRLSILGGDTVRSIIDRAGGLNPSADLRRAYIRREDATSIPVDLEALLVRRDFSADKPVFLGDTIVVPYQRRSVLVEGSVIRPGAYPYNPDFKIEEYIAVAGGITHNGQDISSATRVTPKGTMEHYAPRLAISSGDTIVVPERAFTRAETTQLVIGGVGLLLSSFTLIYAITR